MNAPEMAPFDVCGPLPPAGVTVLEASAGTGKTFTIAALAARYIAEGRVTVDNLLLITFTRMATGELRQRVRERLVSAEQGLTAALNGIRPPAADDVLGRLADAPMDEVRVRRDRLCTALSGFDGATIDTTHAFCQRVLNGLGVAGDVERDATFVEESRDLVDEVVTDFYLRKFVRRGDVTFTLDEARRIAKSVVSNSDAALRPRGDGEDDNSIRRRFAEQVRAEVARRRRRAGILTFDDLLTRLRDTLADERRGEAARRHLRERYCVALVDEFQDTDPVQWEILRRAFVDDGAASTLVLIGDPKQAIYAFRGADVYAYLSAASVADQRATLQVNWRSDQPLLDAYDALFDGAKLGHEGILYRNVRAASGGGRRLAGAPADASLRLRLLHREDGLVKLTNKGYLAADGARGCVAGDLAGDVVRLLSSGAVIEAPGGEQRGERGTNKSRSQEKERAQIPIRPGHIAVLVQRNADAMAVRDALDGVGVPAVVNGAGSVFATPAARDWLRLLEALERPAAANPVRTVALTAFLGWTPERVATAGDAEWEDLHARLHRWAALLRRRGVAALLETISMRQQLSRRLLARPQGERALTDLRHVGQLLHAAVTAEQLGVTALAAWLHTRMDEADDEAGAEDRSRRLESDAEAVQVLTVYRSKGLEFPVVYCPYLWHPGYIDDKDPPVFHDADNGNHRTIDVGANPQRSRHSHLQEARGEQLRLAYVALTRAKHQAVVWWAPTWDSRDSSLCRLLFAKDAEGDVAAKSPAVPADGDAQSAFEALAARAPGCISVERVDGGDGSRWTPAASNPVDLAASSFDRTLDPRWRRTSYSALTSAAHEARVASEAEEPVISDEVLPAAPPLPTATPAPALTAGDRDSLRSVALPLARMPAGADAGTFVHGMLERCDFAAEDLGADLMAAFTAEASRGRFDLGDPGLVVPGLRAAIETPLGPMVDDLRLRDIGRRNRVDELGFELPLAGGDAPTGLVEVRGIGRLLAEHLGHDDIMRAYAGRLEDPSLQSEIRGYLTGSIDLVLRTPAGGYAVVDYKTNWLGGTDPDLTAWHYRPAALIEAMYGAHYPLQALLYTVALHRYLRWRVPGYAPERHLAGTLYLFVRGMIGPDTPQVDGGVCGVFAWRPPATLVEGLSQLFDSGSAAT